MLKAKVVQQAGEEEVPAEIIAQSIAEIAAGMKKLRATRLTDKAIVVLLAESSGVRRNDIKIVLNHLEGLEQIWLKPKKS